MTTVARKRKAPTAPPPDVEPEPDERTDEEKAHAIAEEEGENFYSGNQIPAFVSSGGAFTSWIKQQREKGVRVIYFVTEHGRIGGLKGEVQGKNYREITDKTINNKFVLVRAEI